jgi:Fe-S-cluster containining protein
METKGFPPIAYCAECGGKCCKMLSGTAYPDDFDNDIEKVREALLTGKWAIDSWEDDPNIYFVRPAVLPSEMDITFGRDAPRWPYDPSWGGQCVFLTDTGCELEYSERPTGCRMLEPKEDGECTSHGYGKHHGAKAWSEFQEWLLAFINNPS